jgi:hypothetical protein
MKLKDGRCDDMLSEQKSVICTVAIDQISAELYHETWNAIWRRLNDDLVNTDLVLILIPS